MLRFPPNITSQSFLEEYWQQAPLTFKQAVPNADRLLNVEELYELSLRDDVESRLIIEQGDNEPWQTFHGPQESKRLNSLATKSNWTLLVQSINLWHANCRALLKYFQFIPEWRLDDIMVSYATEQGSVGAHIDQYDVFLIQLTGSKRWLVGEPNVEHKTSLSNSGICHVDDFNPIMDITLNSGDMLYIPPNTVHHGVSIIPGMTLSVGFRSPALSEMMMLMAEQIMMDSSDRYYTDPDNSFNSHDTLYNSSEISNRAMKEAVAWSSDTSDFENIKKKAFGLLQTQPKQELLLSSPEDLISSITLLKRDPAARLAWYQFDNNTIWLFINGEFFQRPQSDIKWITILSGLEDFDLEALKTELQNDKFIILLQLFVDAGVFGIE